MASAHKKIDRAHIDKAWKTFDYNGNGILSLAEIDRAVIDVLPQYAKNKPAIMRAYKAADKSRDGFVDKNEFAALIDYLSVYDELYQKFKKMDDDGDRRVSFEEFEKGWAYLGLAGNDARRAFDAMDKNKGGYILFDEFCAGMTKHSLAAKK
ncbi:hypothetical protein DFS34DRAFT_603928 [Phlyctochytrium arcticum]|nr:hypothetical protein DFS34DRAFT_603928 [Phlyctochytrium arcticum]